MNTDDLLKLYEGDLERVGFILKSGEIVEVENICMEPTQGFDVKGEDLLRYTPIAAATWHTHPDEDSNLSTNDWHSFVSWPGLAHFIIGNDGVTKYVVEDGSVLIAS